MKYNLIIGGKEVETDKKSKVFDKYSGEQIAEVSIATEKEVELALEKAVKAKKSMATLPAHRRAEIILKAVEIIRQKRDFLGKLIAMEAGKPIKYALGEVDRCIENLTFAAEEAKGFTEKPFLLTLQEREKTDTVFTKGFPSEWLLPFPLLTFH